MPETRMPLSPLIVKALPEGTDITGGLTFRSPNIDCVLKRSLNAFLYLDRDACLLEVKLALDAASGLVGDLPFL